MKIVAISLLTTATLVTSACMQKPVGTAEEAPTIVLSKLIVERDLKAGVPYPVTLPYEIKGDGDLKVSKACFTWSGEGPYCFDATHDRDRSEIKVRLRTNNPNNYLLSGSVEYTSNGHKKNTNKVSEVIYVK